MQVDLFEDGTPSLRGEKSPIRRFALCPLEP
jgi:hypothetical protein